ncbi:NYN domain-containing protein [Penicillium digitatum]|uniref:NYN domain-containing protein n=2 Tax=Penicillium digitatum TaxID=36651 RepID=A0A7T6XGJ1_PENDI|nr:NYN domain-containing protein [Penicillium digitatum]
MALSMQDKNSSQGLVRSKDQRDGPSLGDEAGFAFGGLSQRISTILLSDELQKLPNPKDRESQALVVDKSSFHPRKIMAGDTAQKLAVLIDADNAMPSAARLLLAEVAKYGTAHVKRAYGNWTNTNLSGWKEELLTHSIQPIQQFAYTHGENATDSAMIIDGS